MKRSAFELLRAMENSWWYRTRERVVSRVLDRYAKSSTQKVLDFGSGYGGMYEVLKQHGSVVAFEIDEVAREACKKRGYALVYDSVETTLAPAQQYDLIGLFDVVEHVEHDENLAKNLFEALKVGGHVIITVPAFQWLWSIHDEEHQHYRRYTRETASTLLTEAGFAIEYVSYWNMLLFIPAALTRLSGFSGKSALMAPQWLDKAYAAVTWIESAFIPYISLPFGTSLVVIAKRSSS